MDQRVQQYLQNQKASNSQTYEEDMSNKKRELLLSIGIYDKVEIDGTPENSKYVDCEEYDNIEQRYHYYHFETPNISDEEYNAILATRPQKVEECSIAKVLKGIAIAIYIIGAVAGFILIGEDNDYIFEALNYWIEAFIGGTIMLGFGSVVKYLHDIKMKLK